MKEPQKTIVIMTEEEADESHIEHMLRQEGFLVLGTTGSTEGLDLLKARRADGVLLDFRSSRSERMELLSRIRDCDAKVPVVVLASAGSLEGAIEAMKLGAHDYVTQDSVDEQLVVVVRKALEGS